MNINFKTDERILGNSDFVEMVMSNATEKMEHRYRLKTKGYNFDGLVKNRKNLSFRVKREIFIL